MNKENVMIWTAVLDCVQSSLALEMYCREKDRVTLLNTKDQRYTKLV